MILTMSWNNSTSKEILSKLHKINQNRHVSETQLLSSPDGSRHILNQCNDGIDLNDNFPQLSNTFEPRTIWSRYRIFGHENSLINCFWGCQQRVLHYWAKKKIERGVKLYEQNNQNAAVRTWRSVLKTTVRREDSFQLFGYLYRAHMDWGKYREAIDFAHQQLGISEELDSASLRGESYLNLARAHERLGGLEKALEYARHSLYNECGTICRTGGLIHLTVSRVYLEMGGFSRAIEGLQSVHKIASSISDPSLELQVYVALSEIFSRLKDFEKSATYAAKGYDLSRSLQLGDLNSCHHRAALLRMADALRKQGDLGDAQDYCVEATRLSILSGDQANYARSLRIMGDIYRSKLDIDKAFRQYELAMANAASLGDRMSQMEAMDGLARCLEYLRLNQKICNCRPLEFNTRLLEVASSIGSKVLVRKVRCRLALIYRALGDEDQYNIQSRLAHQTNIALGLLCGVCGDVFGLQPEPLELLSCTHILHSRCTDNIVKNGSRICPACKNIFNSKLKSCTNESTIDHLMDAEMLKNEFLPRNDLEGFPFEDDGAAFLKVNENVYQSSLSLASLSLRASSLTINSDKNAISSV